MECEGICCGRRSENLNGENHNDNTHKNAKGRMQRVPKKGLYQHGACGVLFGRWRDGLHLWAVPGKDERKKMT